MTADQLIELLNASQPKPLNPVQEWLLRSAWENKTYSSMAAEKHYAEDYLRKISGEVWSKLSDFWGEPISKLNLRSTLEPRQLTKAQQQLIQEDRSQKRRSTIAPLSLEFPSGPVALDSKFYIERPPTEELAYSAIAQPGCVLRIKAPRKMGKSSLTLRILQRAASLGYRTASVDFQQADAGVFASLNAFLRWFCANVSEELGLEEKLDDYWKQEIGSKVSCTIYFQKYLLASSQGPVVLSLNEINRVFEYPEIAKDFLPMLRYWHEQAKRVQVWQNLRQVVVYSTEIYIPLNLNQSPFNVGLVLKLPVLTVEQVQTLAERHGLDWTDSKAAKQLREMVGGNPYLVRVALYSICRGDVGYSQLLQKPAAAGGIYSDLLRSLLVALQQEPELTAGLKEVISADRGVKLPPLLAHKLDSMGLVNLEDGLCTPACQLYRLYFAEQFLEAKSSPPNRLDQLEKQNETLQQSVKTDPLTELASRPYFDSYLSQQWQKLAGEMQPLSLILCDVDRGKISSDIFGNQAGDAGLQKIAAAVREVMSRSSRAGSSEGLVARYAGDEIAAILPGTNAFTAVCIADRIRDQVKNLALACENSHVDGMPASVVTVSLGVACTIPRAESSAATLVRAAEEALSEAKRKGRDRVAVSSVLDYGLMD